MYVSISCPHLRSDDYDDTIERVMDADYDPLTGAVHFTTLPFGKPLALIEGLLKCTLSVSFNGLNFVDGPDFVFIVEPPKKIGYIFFSAINDFGWTYAQNIGRLETDTQFAGLVRSTYVVDVPEGGECMDAHGKSAWDWDKLSCTTTEGSPHWSKGYELMQKYCEEGYDLIFACSFGYQWQMADLSMRPVCANSKLVHVRGSGGFRTPKLNTAFARIFESRYLAGMVAGRALKAGTVRHNKAVGYLAAFPLPEVKQGINAFTVGCREMFPACDVRVMYIATWGDDFTETKAAEWLWEHEDCDIITQHSDTVSPQIVFAKFGGYGLGYHVDQRLVVGDSVLTSAVIRWGPIFSHFVNRLLNDDYRNGQDYWLGYEAGACDITNVSPEIDQETVNIVAMRKQQLIDGEWQIFCKEPVDNPATTQKSFSGATTGPEEILLHDGSFLDAVTFGSGIPNFAEYTFGGRQRTCLSNFPGILDMWWDVQGVSYPTKSNGKPFEPNDVPEQLPGGTLALKGGIVWYTPPPKDPPNPPDVRLGSLDYHQIELEFASETSEDGDEIVAYMIQADVDPEFSHAKDIAVTNANAEGDTAGKVLSRCGYATDTAMCHVFSIMPDVGLFVSNGDNGRTDRSVPAFTPLQASTDRFPRFLSSVQLQYATLPDDAGKIDLYFLRVAAFDGTSFSEWSQIKTVVKQAIPPLPAVIILYVLNCYVESLVFFFFEV
jgi:basic membrane protein A